MTGLDTPLTPLRYLERAAQVSPSALAIVDGERRWSYAEFAAAAQQLATALRRHGLQDGHRVAYLAANSAELLIAHFAVPLAGGVLVAINTRLAPAEIEYICRHSAASALFADAELLASLSDAGVALDTVHTMVELPAVDGSYRQLPGCVSYDDFTSPRSDSADIAWEVDDEHATISVNYTSGTTGRPKGVMYSHRGAYLNALSEIHHSGFDQESTYLWTLPMFHCNGWCTTWAVTAARGTHVCIRAIRAADMWSLIDRHEVTHLNGAPTVLTTLANGNGAHPFGRPVTITTAGAPPSPTIIARIRGLGALIVHVYGLTETYGPYSVCEVLPDWKSLPDNEQATLMARQGVGMLTNDRLRVVRTEPDELGRLIDVAPDGTEMGEIVMRGNGVMKGYYQDEAATATAFAGGWFHSGDLGVMHPDGYVQLLDRAKDIVVSGGENISTIEVEQALLSHPDVLEAAVVSMPDEQWGERPKAFVLTIDGSTTDTDSLIAHVKTKLASYKAPSRIDIVADLPRTSTGKIRKNELREAEWGTRTTRING